MQKTKLKMKILSLILCSFIIFSSLPINAAQVQDETDVSTENDEILSHDEVYQMTGDYLESLGTPSVSSIGGEWMTIGLARSDRKVPAGYYDNVISYVKEKINEKNQLHRAKSTDNSRVILALTAAGYDPANVAGYNLLDGLAEMNYVQKQGINGPIWALIAFDSYDYEIPEGDVTRDGLITEILNAQLEDHGWALSGEMADADMTGMALQALAPYYNSHAKVKTAVDAAIVRLSAMQYDDGSFGSIEGKCTESTAQVIVALTALGINPESDARFIKNEKSVIDALCSYAVEGGGFKHTEDSKRDGMATEQGYYALTAYMRLINGKTSLYDMSDLVKKEEPIIPDDNPGNPPNDDHDNASDDTTDDTENEQDESDSEEEKEALEEEKVKHVEDLIDSIGTVTLNSKIRINRARTAYKNLTAENQTKVSNLEVLEEAELLYEELLAESKLKKNTKETTVASTSKTITDKKTASTIAADYTTFAESVEELLEGIEADSLNSEIYDAILLYEELTEEEKAALNKADLIEELKMQLAENNQKDEQTGIGVSDCEWNIKLVISDILDVTQIQMMGEKLVDSHMLGIWDIYLEDITTGKRCQPDGTVLVKIPLELLGDYKVYDGLMIVHYTENGSAEYLNSTIVGNSIVFNAVEFSNYAVAGYKGKAPIEGLMTATVNTETNEVDFSWLPWAFGGGCSIAVIVLLVLMMKKNKEFKS